MLEPMADAHIKLENVSYLYDNEISGGVRKLISRYDQASAFCYVEKVDVEKQRLPN